MKRRDFFKKMGGAAVATSVVLAACKSNHPNDIIPADTAMVMQGIDFYGLDATKDHIFIVGGSLGSGTLNKISSLPMSSTAKAR